jgi:hypothetical protein
MGNSKSIGPFYGVRPETDIQILLESSDGVLFSVRKNVASQSQTIRRLIEEVGTERPIILTHVSSNILQDVIRYCTYHSQHSISLTEDDAERREVEYLKKKYEEPVRLLDLAKISNPHYLDIKSLFDVAHRTISEMVNEEIPRRIFEILNVHKEEETSDEKCTRE